MFVESVYVSLTSSLQPHSCALCDLSDVELDESMLYCLKSQGAGWGGLLGLTLTLRQFATFSASDNRPKDGRSEKADL